MPLRDTTPANSVVGLQLHSLLGGHFVACVKNYASMNRKRKMPARRKTATKKLAEAQAQYFLEAQFEDVPEPPKDIVYEFAYRSAGGKGLNPKYPAELESLAYMVGEAQDSSGEYVERGDAWTRTKYDQDMVVGKIVRSIQRDLERMSDIESEVPLTRVPVHSKRMTQGQHA